MSEIQSEMPETIGPYRVLERLGRGGMGEVFLAYDERLDRRVAVKRIRPDAGTSPERRERFRREARVSARLNHPAIVQIYDILTEGDLEHIVMEHVEGADLHKILARGPLDVPQVMRLARQLSDGLDAAHRQGIVHRDFKAENVLVTASGQAKIADFGIAKRLLAMSGEGGDAEIEESLTGGNVVLGTYRTMSPEQARGEPVDHRTDLFALGVLLYEALTGRSPFAAENALATLTRVIHFHQEPVSSLRPGVPAALSALVDDLLQKEPALRPQSAAQVRRELEALEPATASGGTETLAEPGWIPSKLESLIPSFPSLPSMQPPRDSALTTLKARPRSFWWIALAAVAALALTGGYLTLRRPPEPLAVAVLPPEVSAPPGAGDFDLLASGVQAALLRGLTGLQGISPKSADEVRPVAGSPVQVARAVAADEVISSRLVCRPEACRVSLNRLRGADGTVLWAESFELPTDDFHLLANAVTGQVQRAYSDHRPRAGSSDLEVSSEDLKTFLELRRRFDARTGVDLDALLAELASLRRRSPRFLDAYLLEANVARHRFNDSRDAQDLRHAEELIRQARLLAPENPQPLLMLVNVSLDGQELAQAEEALRDLEELIPGDVDLLHRRAQLLRQQGRLAEAIELMRAAARRQPSWKRLLTLARMEQQGGQIAAARKDLELLLERSPGNFEALNQLAQIELTSGSLERAAELYARLVRDSPGSVQRSNLGVAYLLLGRYAEAADSFASVAAEETKNPFYTLNLADARFLTGRREEARALYQRVVDLIDADSGTSPQLLSVKAQALAHLGQSLPAVTAAQEASRRAPDDAAVAFETSLVYALLGEDASALVNAGKALKLGYDPRFFNLPWFGAVRARPDFQSLLRPRPR
jgi:serine/threonine protein kinase/tetratricopeptide (TPR) repeat protein